MNKTLLVVIILALILIVGYFLFKSPVTKTPSGSEEITNEEEIFLPSEKIITYSDNGYTPATITVKAGETVVFNNNSNKAMWTASAIHPSHAIYPIKGGCIDSLFDACEGIASDGKWSFKFNAVGVWKYHNHLNPSDTGTVVVAE